MTIRDIVVSFGFQVDKQSEKSAENSIQSLKSFAGKLLGTIAIGFSLSNMNALAEEFNGINDMIKNGTRELGEQAEIQQKILQAANETKSGYADTAKVVSNLVQENKDLFGSVDDAIAFHNATTKLFKTAGKADEEIASLQEAINKSFAKGAVDSETMNQLLERSPEAVALLNKQLGTSSEQLVQMATDGAISLSDLKNAFVSNADEINKNFDNLDYSISDAMLNIRNQWGLFCDSLWTGSGITNGVGKMMVKAFTSLMDILKKLQPYIERLIRIALSGIQRAFDILMRVGSFLGRLINRIGGLENAIKLIAIVAGAIWLALNAQKILGFLKGMLTLLKGVNLKIMLMVAVIVVLALLVEDFINFMQGNDSVIGSLFEKAGIDADAAREKIMNAWGKAKEFLIAAWEYIKSIGESIFRRLQEFWDKWGDKIVASFKIYWDTLKSYFSSVLTIIVNIFQAFKNLFNGDWEGLWENVKNIVSEIWHGIINVLSGILDILWTLFGDTFTKIKDGIVEKVTSIKDAIVNGITEAVDWIKSLPSQALQWGADMITGFVDGIKGAMGKVKDAVKGVADKITSFLHFSVPDEGPLTEYESWMPDFMGGLAKGIEDNQGTVLDKVRKLTEGIQTLTQAAIATSQTAMNSSSSIAKTVNQNVNINNSYSGSDRQVQANISKGMNKSANDAANQMAKALAYVR